MIGVFDSGQGGLSIYAALKKRSWQNDFLYVGDHVRCPYGARSSTEIVEATKNATIYLFESGCSIVLLACNTATAVALRTLQQEWLPRTPYAQRRILGIIAPTVEALTHTPWGVTHSNHEEGARQGCVAVFATPRTVQSGVYKTEVEKRCPQMALIEQECPALAEAIEALAPANELKKQIAEAWQSIEKKLAGKTLNRAVLGCTHYALIEDVFRDVVPKNIPLLSQGEIVADSLADYLHRHPTLAGNQGSASWQFETTGDVQKVQNSAAALLGQTLEFKKATF